MNMNECTLNKPGIDGCCCSCWICEQDRQIERNMKKLLEDYDPSERSSVSVDDVNQTRWLYRNFPDGYDEYYVKKKYGGSY